MTMGEKLKKIRGDRTLKDVSEATGIKISTLSNYENDYRTPKDNNKKILCKFYEESIEKIFFDN